MKKMIVVILALMLCLSGTASAVTFDDVVGTWHAVVYEEQGIQYYSPEFENTLDVELKNDGTGVLHKQDGEQTEFDWSLNRDTLVIDGTMCEFQDNEIIMNSDGIIVHFSKEFPEESKFPTEIKVSDPSELYGIWSMKKMYTPASSPFILTEKAFQKFYGNYRILINVQEDDIYVYTELGKDINSTSMEYTFSEGIITWTGNNGILSKCMLSDSGELVLFTDDGKAIFVRCDDQMWFCENCNLFVEGNFCNNCGSKRPYVQ